MNTSNLRHLIDALDAGSISVYLFISALLLSFVYIVRKTARFKISEVLNLKNSRDTLIKLVFSTLNDVDLINDELIKQKNMLEYYSDDTIKKGIDASLKVLGKSRNLYILADSELSGKIIFYFSGLRNMMSELYTLEKDSYNFQKEYQQKVVFYNRSYEEYKNHEQNEELLLAYKKAVSIELDEMKSQILSGLNLIKTKRDNFVKEIELSCDLIKELRKSLMDYKHKNLDTKHFYPRYLAFV